MPQNPIIHGPDPCHSHEVRLVAGLQDEPWKNRFLVLVSGGWQDGDSMTLWKRARDRPGQRPPCLQQGSSIQSHAGARAQCRLAFADRPANCQHSPRGMDLCCLQFPRHARFSTHLPLPQGPQGQPASLRQSGASRAQRREMKMRMRYWQSHQCSHSGTAWPPSPAVLPFPPIHLCKHTPTGPSTLTSHPEQQHPLQPFPRLEQPSGEGPGTPGPWAIGLQSWRTGSGFLCHYLLHCRAKAQI